MRAVAIAGGWLYAVGIIWLSLTPSPPQIDVANGDKLGHCLAYGALMFWFCWLYPGWKARIVYGAGWIALGVALEFVQRATGYRTFELADMAADALGVLGGALAYLGLLRVAAAKKEKP
jgi:VanZ family protein